MNTVAEKKTCLSTHSITAATDVKSQTFGSRFAVWGRELSSPQVYLRRGYIAAALGEVLFADIIALVQIYDSVGYRWSRSTSTTLKLQDSLVGNGDTATNALGDKMYRAAVCADKTIGEAGGLQWSLEFPTRVVYMNARYGAVWDMTPLQDDNTPGSSLRRRVYSVDQSVMIKCDTEQRLVLRCPTKAYEWKIRKRGSRQHRPIITFIPDLTRDKLKIKCGESECDFDVANLAHYRPFVDLSACTSCTLLHDCASNALIELGHNNDDHENNDTKDDPIATAASTISDILDTVLSTAENEAEEEEPEHQQEETQMDLPPDD